MKKILFPICFIILTIVSCKKDDKKDTCTTSTTSLSGSYKITAVKYKQTPASPEEDFFLTFDACEKDDILILASNGTFTSQDAGIVCVPNGSYTSTWSYIGTTFTIDGDAATIQSFDCTTLVAYQTDQAVAGDRVTYTLVKQ